jgi:preprotein translocase subunit Sec63
VAATVVTPLSAGRERRHRERVEVERHADRAIDRERLLAKRAQIADCDYFAVLGLGRAATPHEIERAFERLRADFAPERFAEPLREELRDALAEIKEILDEAHHVLSDAGMRDAYRAHLQPTE